MNKSFDSLDQLKSELADYVHWFNNSRIHGSLDIFLLCNLKNHTWLNDFCPIFG